MTTKFNLTVTINDDYVILDFRNRGQLTTQVVKRDSNLNQNVGEQLLALAPQQKET